MKISFLKCLGAERGHPKMLFILETMALLLLSCFAGSHCPVLWSPAGSPINQHQPLGTRERFGSGAVTEHQSYFWGTSPCYLCV